MSKRVSSEPAAFTLIELLVVITIIAFLAATLGVSVMKLKEKAKHQATKARLGILAQALTDYHSTFLAFPPTTWSGATFNNTDEWWRWLTFTGGAQYLRPQKYDGSIVQEAFCKEADLGIPTTGAVKLPQDAWLTDIRYVFPIDYDVGDLDLPLGSPVKGITAALAYYHCAVVSWGPDRQGGSILPGSNSIDNPGLKDAYDTDTKNADNESRLISAQ